MQINFMPNKKVSGCCSYIDFTQGDFRDAIRRMFNESERERIVAIDIDKHGITAKFETRTNSIRQPSD